MSTSTITSREFNQDTSGAKKAAGKGPVIITRRGKPAHVLLSIAEYRRLTGGARHIADLLAMPDAADLELDTPRSRDLPRPSGLD